MEDSDEDDEAFDMEEFENQLESGNVNILSWIVYVFELSFKYHFWFVEQSFGVKVLI